MSNVNDIVTACSALVNASFDPATVSDEKVLKAKVSFRNSKIADAVNAFTSYASIIDAKSEESDIEARILMLRARLLAKRGAIKGPNGLAAFMLHNAANFATMSVKTRGKRKSAVGFSAEDFEDTPIGE